MSDPFILAIFSPINEVSSVEAAVEEGEDKLKESDIMVDGTPVVRFVTHNA